MKEPPAEEREPKQLLITIDEAARRLSIGRSHIYAEMQRGRLRSVQIGRSRRILERDLDEFVGSLLDGADWPAMGSEKIAKRAPVKRLPSRAGRR